MKHYDNISDYYKAYGHTPPKLDYFDVRPFEQYYEEDKTQTETFKMEPFHVEFYGIGLMVEGTAKSYLGKPFNANMVFYSPYQLISFDDVQRNWKGYYLMFDQDYLTRCSFGATFLTDFPFLRLDNVHPVTITQKEVDELLPIFEKIYTEFNSENKDKFILIESYLNLLLHYIKRATADIHIEDTDFRNKAEINLVAQYKSLIEKHLNKDELQKDFFSTTFYAEQLNIHPNHLNAVVKRVVNATAKQLIHDAIIVKAKSLLIQTQLTAKEISFQLGFEEPSHFSNLFKKQTALTPAHFRQINSL